MCVWAGVREHPVDTAACGCALAPYLCLLEKRCEVSSLGPNTLYIVCIATIMFQLFTVLAVADIVTIYHVNPSNYSAQGIAEMDTGKNASPPPTFENACL